MKNATGLSSRLHSQTPASAEKMAELDEMARQNRIQERLAEVKKSI
jgi:hypothetical protein